MTRKPFSGSNLLNRILIIRAWLTVCRAGVITQLELRQTSYTLIIKISADVFINIYTYIVRNWNLLLRQTESFKRYRLPTNISASIVKVFSFLKSISVLSTWKSSGVMSAKILISSNGISYDSETLFW